MIIKKINISNFGKLTDFEMKPSKGLNIIYAPNESGKSTLISFIKYIFYGSKYKKHPDDLTFKERYMPWNGLPMSGSLEISKKDNTYLVERLDNERTSKLSVLDALSGEKISDASTPGAYFMGIGERAFSDSCFVNDVFSLKNPTSDGELISLLSDSYDDKSTYTIIRQTLNEKLMKITSTKRKSSELSVIENSILDNENSLREINDKIKSVRDKINLTYETENKIAEIKSEIAKLKDIKNNIEYNKILHNKNKLFDEKIKLEKEILAADKPSNNLEITDNEKNLLLQDFSDQKSMISNLRYTLFKNMFFMFGISLLFILFAFLSFYNKLFFFGVIPFLFLFTYFTFSHIKISKKIKSISAEIASLTRKKQNIMNKYSLNDFTDCVSFVSSINNGEDISNQKEKSKFLQKHLDLILTQINECELKLKNTKFNSQISLNDINFFTNKDMDVIIHDKEKQLSNLSNSLMMDLHYRNEISNLNREAQLISDEIERLNALKNEALSRADVIETAINILDTCFVHAKNTVFPEISKRTFEIYHSITSGDITSLATDENFNIKLNSNGFLKDARFLSAGAMEALYFSLRIAIIDMLSPDGVAIPIFLDDVFSHCDDQRTKKLLDLIYNLSKYHQIFLCTCKKSEGEYFNDKPDVKIFRM